MGTRSAVAGVVALSLGCGVSAPARAQVAEPQQLSAAAATRESARSDPTELDISLSRIRFALEQPQPIQLSLSLPAPTFRVRIVEKYRAVLPSFAESLKVPWQPVPPGGRTAYELMNMVTPALARPYAAFNSSELAQVVAVSLVSSLLMRALTQGVQSISRQYRDRQEEAAREEVKRELEEFLAQHPDALRPTWWTGVIK